MSYTRAKYKISWEYSILVVTHVHRENGNSRSVLEKEFTSKSFQKSFRVSLNTGGGQCTYEMNEC